MNYKMVGQIIAPIMAVEAVFMLPPFVISLFDRDSRTAVAFLLTIAIIMAVAAVLWLWCRKAQKLFQAREGLVCVALGWIVVSLFGCLPFIFSGQIPNFIDALFEIVSGFSTTGASILQDVESLSRGILYWRSFSHWLGGMGILVFVLAVLPATGRGGYGMHLLRAESPGPEVGKLVPRMKQTAMILYLLYILFTLLNFLFLLFGRMPWFESICTAFGTAGTGGFSIKNNGMAGYSPYLQNVTTIFMILFGVNFNIYYMLMLRHFRSVLKNEELRLYIIVIVCSILFITLNIRGYYASLAETVRHAAFQVSSVITTTGFATTNFDQWPSFSKTVMLFLMFIGACAGSTGGGFKCGRLLLLLKTLRRNIRKVLHPQMVQVVRANGQVIDEKILDGTSSYLAAYVIIFIFSFILVSLDGFSITSNFSAVLACLNNIGPGLEAVGPTQNYASFGVISKLVLIANMLIGRLEIFPILALFSRSTWSHR
ncbi:MAG TPA: TrkH family potassium uptake protein [Clostridiales bacterium]|jgi:trk system potassium uptake protein TrkH|nr:TrkH family potassium uptake protein [Clostridiales bacterium]